MKVVVQRVSQASVDVVNELGTIDPTFEPQQIGSGFMLLVGVTDEDGEEQLSWLAHKILNLRVFEDEQGKMNRSIKDIGGEILSISQFTLFADVRKGNRPSFVKAGKPEHANITWIKFNEALRSGGVPVREGRFGTHMRVGLIDLRARGLAQVKSDEVGRAILKPLRDLDEVAYMRFASVYQNFENLEDFQNAIDELKADALK